MRWAVIIVAVLAGCETNRNIPVKPELAEIPASLKEECPDVYRIPPGDLGTRAVARGWQQDRDNLRICRARHSGLVKAIDARDRIQGGQE